MACKTPAPSGAGLLADEQGGAPEGCEFVKAAGKSKRFDCGVSGTTIHLLVQEGNFVENSRDNAALFAQEIERGTLLQITDEVDAFLKGLTPSEKDLVKSMLGCLTDRVHDTVSQEFADGVDQAYGAYVAARRAGGAEPKFSQADVRLGAYGIELGVLMDGIRERVQFGGPIKAAAAITDLVKLCGSTMSNAVADNFFKIVTEEALRRMSFSRGCSGFVATGGMTKDGELIHARNMDGEVVDSWNKDLTVYMIKEPGEGNYPFVATATAGVFYPGGVSGFNSQGISVSIHEMSTINYKLYMSGRKSDIAPYVLQRILRNAGSIDDAIAIVKSMPHVAAWTVLVSDGQRNEAASIEFSADRIRVARRGQQSIGQANHFIHPEMTDQAYTPKFNKTMESRSRFDALTRQLTNAKAQGKVVDVPWAMFHIAGHEDDMGKFRSFGRVVAKNYTSMSTVAVPFRHDGRLPEIWFSIGDRRPIPHSHFTGYAVDLKSFSLKPLGVKRSDWGKPSWEKSIATAILGKDAAKHGDNAKSVEHLTQAIQEAKQDGIDEIPYYFMRGRMLQLVPDHDAAMRDFNFLWSVRQEVDRYQQALIAFHSVISSDAASEGSRLGADERAARAKFASNTFKNLYADERHTDLKKKWDLAKDLVAGKKVEPLKNPDFAILE